MPTMPKKPKQHPAEYRQADLDEVSCTDGTMTGDGEETCRLERTMTAREASLKLRYAMDEAEYRSALAVLEEKLSPDSPAREDLVMWVRSSLLEAGASEVEVAKVTRLEDLGGPVVNSWWTKERQDLLRKETAKELAALLEGVSGPGRFAEVADLIIDCTNGPELLAHVAQPAGHVHQAGRKFGSTEGLALT